MKTSMKAVMYREYGDEGILQLEELPIPEAAPDEVLIEVHATTVNRTDCAMLTAKPFVMRFLTGLLRPKNPVLGTVFAGEVVALGSAVTEFAVGDRVFGFDDMGASSFAEYTALPVGRKMLAIGADVAVGDAAACIEGAHYALNFINKVPLRVGDDVLVNGATGAIGSALVQLLRHYGANVVATANTPNLQRVADLGAARVIDYTATDFTRDDERFDYVFDAVAKSTFFRCRRLLKPTGTYLSGEMGWFAHNGLLTLAGPLLGRKRVRFPFPLKTKKSLALVNELLASGELRPVVEREYSLEDVPAAFRHALSGTKTGNLLVALR